MRILAIALLLTLTAAGCFGQLCTPGSYQADAYMQGLYTGLPAPPADAELDPGHGEIRWWQGSTLHRWIIPDELRFPRGDVPPAWEHDRIIGLTWRQQVDAEALPDLFWMAAPDRAFASFEQADDATFRSALRHFLADATDLSTEEIEPYPEARIRGYSGGHIEHPDSHERIALAGRDTWVVDLASERVRVWDHLAQIRHASDVFPPEIQSGPWTFTVQYHGRWVSDDDAEIFVSSFDTGRVDVAGSSLSAGREAAAALAARYDAGYLPIEEQTASAGCVRTN